MDKPGYVFEIAVTSSRILDVLLDTDLAAPVPSCPRWNLADLAWHIAEVQHFWGTIVDRLADSPDEVERFDRPADEALIDYVAAGQVELMSALRRRSAEDRCWSWHPAGTTVGWVARRQAHEALIHRVDAELAAGWEVTPAGLEVAIDGVDEILGVLIDGPLPPWAEFVSEDTRLAIEPSDFPERWVLEFGRFTGTSPDSGTTYDEDDARVSDDGGDADAIVTGLASDLYLWLWGRASESDLEITGDRSLAPRLRAIAVGATQ
jgi:uncharacterized protein (TIGR03083 family)